MVFRFCFGSHVTKGVLNKSTNMRSPNGDENCEMSSKPSSLHEESNEPSSDITMKHSDTRPELNSVVGGPTSLKLEDVFAIEDGKPMESDSFNGFAGFRDSINMKKQLNLSTHGDKDDETCHDPPELQQESSQSREDVTMNESHNEGIDAESIAT